jgi:hypothetical protein
MTINTILNPLKELLDKDIPIEDDDGNWWPHSRNSIFRKFNVEGTWYYVGGVQNGYDGFLPDELYELWGDQIREYWGFGLVGPFGDSATGFNNAGEVFSGCKAFFLEAIEFFGKTPLIFGGEGKKKARLYKTLGRQILKARPDIYTGIQESGLTTSPKPESYYFLLTTS